MEQEISTAATANGGVTNSDELTTEAVAPSVFPNVFEGNNSASVAAVAAGNIVNRKEKSNNVVLVKSLAMDDKVEEVVVERDIGNAEYLEDTTPDHECEDERDLTKVKALAVVSKNKQNENSNEEKVGAATYDTEKQIEEKTYTPEHDEQNAAAEVHFEEEEGNEVEDEAELITGDDAQEQIESVGCPSEKVHHRNQEEQVDENQCRVCTTKEQLLSLFTKTNEGSTPADMLLLICPNVSIALKDFMPQFICCGCLENLTLATKLRKQLETTERDLRKRLSRSKNKVRRPRGYVVIDAPVSDSDTEEDEEELNDDVEFKVSDVADSTSGESDSADTDISEKRKPGRRRGRKKSMKRATGSNEEEYPRKKIHVTPSASGSVANATHGPFECDQCNLSFQRKQSYVMHRKMHESRQEYHCQICNKKFKVRGAYKTHMERHASERAQFRCELCAQVFRLRAELKRHMALSHDEHGIIYECKRCQRTFLTQTRLQRHQSTNCSRYSEQKVKRQASEGQPSQGRDLFKSVAPLTTTYWSDSFSD